jgi:hypothetical protein
MEIVGIFCGHLVYIFCRHSIYFTIIWYIFPCFGTLSQTNLATLEIKDVLAVKNLFSTFWVSFYNTGLDSDKVAFHSEPFVSISVKNIDIG